jgi:hypothetical protein
MASPLTFYVQIKQDETSQAIAQAAVAEFGANVAPLLNETQIVHYATLALIPNLSTTPGVASKGSSGILLMTDFDLAMIPYLQVFYDKPGIMEFINVIASISYNPVPPINTFTDFENFIIAHNLSPAPPATSFKNQFYQAYQYTVKQVLTLK